MRKLPSLQFDQFNRWKSPPTTLLGGRPFLLLALIAGLGAALRVYRLNARGLWLDEAYSVLFATRSISAIVTNTAEKNPPLYYLLLHVWTAFFGTSEQALRSLSVVFGTVAIVLIGLLGFSLYDHRTGLLAAALMAMMVFPLHYAREARAYSLFLVLTIGSFHFCFKGLQDHRWRDWIGYLLVSVALSYTHNYWIFNILAQNLYVLLCYRADKRKLLRWIIVQAGVVLCFLPWLIPMLTQTGKVMREGFWIRRPDLPDLTGALRSYVAFLVRPQVLWGYILLAGLGALGGTSLTGGRGADAVRDTVEPSRWQWHPHTAQRSVFLLLWFACPLFVPFYLSQFVSPIFFPRYMIAAIPAFYLLIARGVWQVPTILLRGLVISGMALISLASLQNYYSFSRGGAGLAEAGYYFMYPTEPWREWVAFLARHVEPTDLIIVSPQGSSPPFRYYAKDALPYHRVPAVLKEEDRAGVASSLATLTRGKRRLWLVLRWEFQIRRAHLSGAGEESIVQFLESRYEQIQVRSSVEPRRNLAVFLFDLTRLRGPTSHRSTVSREASD